jgi:hypothetical protein
MADPNPRYEFRTWAQTLAELKDKLQQFASLKGSEQSQETYLISASTERCNAKIRNQLMDLKLLLSTDRGLQRWKPVLKADFPLDRSVITTRIFPALELPPPQLDAERFSISEFLKKLSGCSGIAIVQVAKSRMQFTVDGCQAEFASVTIEALTQDTVAVESENPEAVLNVMGRLGLEGAPNTSYIRKIKEVLNP